MGVYGNCPPFGASGGRPRNCSFWHLIFHPRRLMLDLKVQLKVRWRAVRSECFPRIPCSLPLCSLKQLQDLIRRLRSEKCGRRQETCRRMTRRQRGERSYSECCCTSDCLSVLIGVHSICTNTHSMLTQLVPHCYTVKQFKQLNLKSPTGCSFYYFCSLFLLLQVLFLGGILL